MNPFRKQAEVPPEPAEPKPSWWTPKRRELVSGLFAMLVIIGTVLWGVFEITSCAEAHDRECADLPSGNRAVSERASEWAKTHGYAGPIDCEALTYCRTDNTPCFVRPAMGTAPAVLTCNVNGCVERVGVLGSGR